MIRLLVKIRYLNFRTIYFNIRWFGIRGFRLPVAVSPNCWPKVKGRIILPKRVVPFMLKIGYGDVGTFDKRNKTIFVVKGKLVLKGKASLGHGSALFIADTGEVIFGQNVQFTAEVKIDSHKAITFGDDCLVSWDVLIMDTDHHDILNNLTSLIVNKPEPIHIGNEVWIGCRTMILKGAKIPDNTIIAAGTIITKHFNTQNTIIGGIPGRIIKRDVSWRK